MRICVGKAAGALAQTVTRMCGLDDDRETLERHLLAVECKLANAEERSQSNRYLKSWMEKLKDVAYEAEDVLDDFEYEALRRKAQIGDSTFRKVLGYVTCRSPLLFRFAMSRKLKAVLNKIKELVKEMNRFGLVDSVTREGPQLPWRQTHSKLDKSTDVFGRDDDKEGVVKLLLDQQDQRKVQVLPIFGMGGLGKTALAKMLKMWHCVSENFDVIAIVKSIIELATNERYNPPDSIELLQKKLDEVIGRKRFFLVLDDVWNEEKTIWEDNLKPLLCSIGGIGSVIVVTCRSEQVATIMCTIQPLKLACLREEDSWELFSKKAFSSDIVEQAELATVGRRIVNKCGGLPLALNTIGGLLSSKQQVEEWGSIERSNIGDNEVMPILKLSYKHLSSEMKQCFALCALFQKDYEMQKDMLIQLWMANGFIQQEGTTDLTQKGECMFSELVWRSFLQDTKVVVTSSAYVGSSEYETTDVDFKKISGLFDGKTSVRTLLSPSGAYIDFNRLPQLERMPRNIGELSNLRTLTTFVVDTRDGCGIEELKDLQQLCNRLELYNLRKIKSVMHAKDANLHQKQNPSELLFSWGLTKYDEPENEACNEEEVFQCLKPHSKTQFSELYGYGGLEIPQWMRNPRMFQCLRKLTISNWTRCKNIPVVWLSPSLEYLSLENMGKLKTLCDNLCIEGGGHSTPLQIFPKLKKMILKELPSLERWAENSAGVSIDSLVTFPVLEELIIDDCPKLASFAVSPVLKVLRATEALTSARNSFLKRDDSSPEENLPLPQMEHFPSLPTSLEILWIQGFECLVALPWNLGHLTELRELLVNNCTGLKALPDGMDGLTSLRQLTIGGSPGIEELPNGLLQRLPALDEISIYGCPELERRCREGGEYFHLVPVRAESEFRIRVPEAESEIRTGAPEVESSGKKFLRRICLIWTSWESWNTSKL
ncbi:putative disease resistance protein RGA1 [Triticum aestivum]|uniref:putative disease resistance protein RGA1 n=1 Tax=Triticum aestivum TaxID=4565 RepID=UPI001D029E1B|nr:putative disease resistance protein RGA1 [Triticum aestivum]